MRGAVLEEAEEEGVRRGVQHSEIKCLCRRVRRTTMVTVMLKIGGSACPLAVWSVWIRVKALEAFDLLQIIINGCER